MLRFVSNFPCRLPDTDIHKIIMFMLDLDAQVNNFFVSSK